MMHIQTEINNLNKVQYWMGVDALNSSKSILKGKSSVFILVDEHTEKFCLPLFRKSWESSSDASIIRITSGEKNKNLNTVHYIWEQLTDGQADRHSILVNLGGGVITDMGGFAAAAFKRGMPFVHIPTTLLAQVDAAIGGKTGVDFNGFKNHIGFFKEPISVIIDPVFLNSLDQRQRRSGFAEIIKYGLIMDADLWKLITQYDVESVDNKSLEDMIVRSAQNKIRIVKEDSQESGLRKILNFGHTLGHALETFFLTTDNPITHGEAIAAGMICEAWISTRVAGLSSEALMEIEQVIDRMFSRLVFNENEISELINLTRQDKKARSGKIRYSLINSIGSSIFDVEISDKVAEDSLRYYIQNH